MTTHCKIHVCSVDPTIDFDVADELDADADDDDDGVDDDDDDVPKRNRCRSSEYHRRTILDEVQMDRTVPSKQQTTVDHENVENNTCPQNHLPT
jgi:hypothetical protein